MHGEVTRILKTLERGGSETGQRDQMSTVDPAKPASGDAIAQLLPLVYDELRSLASARIARERPGQTLQATALVHEAYLRLLGPGMADNPHWQGRPHFFGAAAEAMRRILIDRARAKKAAKRGGDAARINLHESRDTRVDAKGDDSLNADIDADLGALPLQLGELAHSGVDLVDLDAALTAFAAEEPQKAELVRLRSSRVSRLRKPRACSGSPPPRPIGTGPMPVLG